MAPNKEKNKMRLKLFKQRDEYECMAEVLRYLESKYYKGRVSMFRLACVLATTGVISNRLVRKMEQSYLVTIDKDKGVEITETGRYVRELIDELSRLLQKREVKLIDLPLSKRGPRSSSSAYDYE
jgi:Mn-dependent DtxR family transcriptional regulator